MNKFFLGLLLVKDKLVGIFSILLMFSLLLLLKLYWGNLKPNEIGYSVYNKEAEVLEVDYILIALPPDGQGGAHNPPTKVKYTVQYLIDNKLHKNKFISDINYTIIKKNRCT